MDPVGPWSTYPYNRLAAVQAPTTTGDLHHLPAGSTAPTSTTSATQILPAGFLSPPPVGYEVFSPLFHPGGAAKPPSHYVNQHRQALAQSQSTANVANPKQNSDGEYHQGFFDQNAAAWQQSGPFGILPHETGGAKTGGGYENFNAHFVPQHVNKCGPRPRSPSAVNLPQTCIVTSPSVRNTTVNRVTVEKSSVQSQIQTKAQTKIYPELGSGDRSRNEPQEQNQSSPNNWAGNKRNFGTYRHYGNENGADTNRKPSPLHSQPSPMSHSHSPSSGYPLYNSPLSSISSPQQSNQVTPPLDASVSRTNHQQTGPSSSQSGNIVYSSVITKNNERFQGNNQNCWDERRKFPPQANYANMEIPNLQNRNLLNMDRQQYYDSSSNNQVTMTDLSSCRGDPMSIVKNLQQNCIASSDIKQEDKHHNNRRRKSGDNKPESSSSSMENYYPNPIPPPAHTSGSNQQQNGTYFEFERWNQPKLFASQPIHQHQHQGIMVHGPPPPIPYFPTFHLPHHHTNEYPSSVDSITNYGEQSHLNTNSNNNGNGSFTQQQQQQQEDQSKVIVPNIEEELNFLSEVELTSDRNNYGMKASEPKSHTAGFMNSYLKFLQGEKESSPPPTSRNNRKQSSWRKLTNINELPKDTNGIITPIQSNHNIQNIQNIHLSQHQQMPNQYYPRPISQGDPQDDPRYFPLPKERNKNTFDSSDDGFSSEDDYFNRKLATSFKQEPIKDRPRKGRPPKVGGPADKKKNKEYKDRTKIKENRELKIKPTVTPRRETCKRAAKDKCTIKQLIARDDEFDEPGDFADSDSDPAWTPMAKEDVDDDVPVKKKRGRKKGFKLVVPQAQSTEDDLNARRKRKEQRSDHILSGTKSPSEEDGFFKFNKLKEKCQIGEFVVIQNELIQEWPAIWRVDGKTLLQKYEPFEQNGYTLYRNISTYTSWTPESKKQYITVPVRYKSQGQMETIVEFLRREMTFVDENFVSTVLKENEVYQDNFEVYIQTLISQALDSNFLTEIFQEKDDYFLSNVQTIDDITNKKTEKLTSLLNWSKPTEVSVCTWPCYNVIKELGVADSQSKNCAGCGFLGVSVRVLLYGQPYNSTTLEGCQPNPQAVNEKDFLMCRICANRVQLLNKITHQKYLMYIECAKRVADKRISDPQKDTTCILNELLADEAWLNQLFFEVRTAWCEVESLEHNHRTRISPRITE
nr:uncharacterized protein LOC111418023 isoform X1 [Onthophagus taurus]XP_022906226.1 uncharacterized protein LOC111418023 isoform X1 [Onthophagus taurus]